MATGSGFMAGDREAARRSVGRRRRRVGGGGQGPRRPPGGDIRYPAGMDQGVKNGVPFGPQQPPGGGFNPAFKKKWDNFMQMESGFHPDTDFAGLRGAAKQAFQGGADWRDIRAGLASPIASQLLAANAAGGQGQASPYMDFFKSNPGALGQLGQFARGGEYTSGPGGTQEQLFAQFPGLKESYLASLGKQIVNGQVVPIQPGVRSPSPAPAPTPAPLPSPFDSQLDPREWQGGFGGTPPRGFGPYQPGSGFDATRRPRPPSFADRTRAGYPGYPGIRRRPFGSLFGGRLSDLLGGQGAY